MRKGPVYVDKNNTFTFITPEITDVILLGSEYKYRICSRNLRTFFLILAAEKSGCVKYADFFCGGLDLGFVLV